MFVTDKKNSLILSFSLVQQPNYRVMEPSARLLRNPRSRARSFDQAMYNDANSNAISSIDPPIVDQNPANRIDIAFASGNRAQNIPTQPVVDNEQSESIPILNTSPDVLVYEANPTTANIEANSNPNGAVENTQQNPSAPYQSNQNNGLYFARNQTNSRCPYLFRRLSASNYMPNQIRNNYLRPAYAPHESLWNLQQHTQELHRRHMTNSMNPSMSNEAMPINTFNAYPGRTNGSASVSNATLCVSCNQHHPNTHPNRRLRPHVCHLNLVSVSYAKCQMLFHSILKSNFFVIFILLHRIQKILHHLLCGKYHFDQLFFQFKSNLINYIFNFPVAVIRIINMCIIICIIIIHLVQHLLINHIMCTLALA